MKNKNPKILIQSKGNLDYVDFQNVDVENNGSTNMNEIDFNNSGYHNKKSGITNIEGKLNTDISIKNGGLFNIKKTGVVNILKKRVGKVRWWESTWVQILMLFGALASIIGLIVYL